MFKKLIIICLSVLLITFNVNAASDGELILKKNQPSEVKDCFENLNRATFAFNQVLDGIIFEPVANVYKKLPSPVKSLYLQDRQQKILNSKASINTLNDSDWEEIENQ